jgi:hypothetical protein
MNKYKRIESFFSDIMVNLAVAFITGRLVTLFGYKPAF